MRLVTFHADYGLRVGAVLNGDEYVLDLHRACEAHHAELGHGKPRAMADLLCPTSMIEFLRGGDDAMLMARRLLAGFTSHIGSPRALKEVVERRIVLPRKGLRLAAPVPRPGKIPCGVRDVWRPGRGSVIRLLCRFGARGGRGARGTEGS